MAVLCNEGIRMGASAAGGGDYQIEKSIRFNDDDEAFLNITPGSAGDREKWTWSGWVKRADMGTGVFSIFAAYDSSDTRDVLRFESNKLNLQIGTSGTYRTETTDAVFRDPSAWYSICVSYDSDQVTAADRVKIYVNGIEQSVTGTPVDRNTESTINNTDIHYIGARSSDGSASAFFDGLMAEVHFVDGTALDASSFGETNEDTGQWVPKEYTGSYGTNGFHLKFDNTSDLGEDSSGNDNDWTANNLVGSITSLPCVEFDGTGDFLSLAASSDFDFGTGNFTIEGFFYKNATTSNQTLVASQKYYQTGNDGNWGLRITSGTQIAFASYDGTGSGEYTEFSATNGANVWHHFAFVREGTGSNQTKFYFNGTLAGSMTVSKSLTDGGSNGIFIGDDGSGPNSAFNGCISNVRIIKGTALYTSDFTIPSAPLTNVTNTKLLCCQSTTSATASLVAPSKPEPFSGAGGVQGYGSTSDYLQVAAHTDFSLDGDFTVEWWHYRETLVTNDGYMWTIGDSNASTGLELYWGSSGTQLKLFTNSSPSTVTGTSAAGWHHYAVVRSGGDIKVYYDGTEGVSISNSNTFSGNVTIGGEYYNGAISGGMFGPMSQFRLVKGTDVYTSNFTAPTTALTAITNTKLLTLQGSTPFSDNSGTDKIVQIFGNVNTDDISGRGNVAATTKSENVATLDLLSDSPKPFDDEGNGTGNYCTLNPLECSSYLTLADGNLSADAPGTNWGAVLGTIGMSSGLWYWEVDCNTSEDTACSIAKQGSIDLNYSGQITAYGDHEAWGIIANGNKQHKGTSTSYGSSYTQYDVVGVAFDADNGDLYFYVNGVLQNSGTAAFTGLTDGPYLPSVSNYGHSSGADRTFYINFGQRAFTYTDAGVDRPTADYLALNTYNLPDPTIAIPSAHFDIGLDAGADILSTANDLTDGADFVWIKDRDNNSTNHILFNRINDSGMDGTPHLRANSDYRESFCGTYAAPSGNSVAWVWNAGTANVTNDASSTGIGTIDSTYRANTDAGFSIVSYAGSGTTGSTVAHGLNAEPAFILVKHLDNDDNWAVYHKEGIGEDKFMILNSDAQQDFATDYWGSGVINSNTFGIGEDGKYNNESGDHIAYCWSEVAGYSKFGTYVGTGNGPFIYTGFKPKYVLTKQITTLGSDWVIKDSVRDTSNVNTASLIANGVGDENTDYSCDLLSNGFKLRSSAFSVDESGKTYIFAAFAESCFKYSNAQ